MRGGGCVMAVGVGGGCPCRSQPKKHKMKAYLLHCYAEYCGSLLRSFAYYYDFSIFAHNFSCIYKDIEFAYLTIGRLLMSTGITANVKFIKIILEPNVLLLFPDWLRCTETRLLVCAVFSLNSSRERLIEYRSEIKTSSSICVVYWWSSLGTCRRGRPSLWTTQGVVNPSFRLESPSTILFTSSASPSGGTTSSRLVRFQSIVFFCFRSLLFGPQNSKQEIQKERQGEQNRKIYKEIIDLAQQDTQLQTQWQEGWCHGTDLCEIWRE